MVWDALPYALAVKRTVPVEKDLLGRLWLYHPEDGCYTLGDADATIHRQVARLVARNGNGQLPPPNLENIYRYEHSVDVVNVLRQLEPKIWLNPPPPVITCSNRTLKIRTNGTIVAEAHSAGNYATIHLPVEYDPEQTAERWETFLKDILPAPGDRLLLQQWAGACLNPGRPCPKGALFIYGPADAGKSVLAETFTRLFGLIMWPGCLPTTWKETSSPVSVWSTRSLTSSQTSQPPSWKTRRFSNR